MKAIHQGESLSVWKDSERNSKSEFSKNSKKLKNDLSVDVCVIGGGIAGLTTAYLLLQEGKNVCVLEAADLGNGETGKTTAHISAVLGTRYYELEKIHGEKNAKLIIYSHKAAIDKIESIVNSEKIECDLLRVNGYLVADNDNSETLKKEIEQELETVQHLGWTDVSLLRAAPLEAFESGICLQLPNQMQFHPLKYLNALTQKINLLGGLIYTQTKAILVEGGDAASVKTADGFKIDCESIVVATNTPINDMFTIHTKQAPYRTYAMAFKIMKDSIQSALYWDTLDPYHYVRFAKGEEDDFDILIVGGEDHKTGQEDHPEFCFDQLEQWTRARFSTTQDILYSWSGQVMEPVDGIGFLGRNPMDKENVYVITGDSGNGITHATLGAIIITDQIMERDNP